MKVFNGLQFDRRHHRRRRIKFSVLFQITGPIEIFQYYHGEEIAGKITDLSQDGIGLQCERRIPCLANIYLNILLYESRYLKGVDYHEFLRITGVVRYCRLMKDKSYRLGITLQEMDSLTEQLLDDVITSPISYL